MKKFLTKAFALSLMVGCLFVSGCLGGLTNKNALQICKDYVLDLTELHTTIKSNDYVYPIEAAKQAATEVKDTDKSGFGIEFSNYRDFEYNPSEGFQGNMLLKPKILYPGAIGVLLHLDRFVNYLDAETFKLKTTYKLIFETSEEYFRAHVNKDKLYINTQKDNSYSQYIIDFDRSNGIDWTSVEYKSITYKESGAVSYYFYYYLEQATNENRIADREMSCTWRVDSATNNLDQLAVTEFDEVAQKMLIFDDVCEVGDANPICQTIFDFMQSQDYTSYVNVLDINNNVVEINTITEE